MAEGDNFFLRIQTCCAKLKITAVDQHLLASILNLYLKVLKVISTILKSSLRISSNELFFSSIHVVEELMVAIPVADNGPPPMEADHLSHHLLDPLIFIEEQSLREQWAGTTLPRPFEDGNWLGVEDF